MPTSEGTTAPVTYGQLSVLRSLEALGPDGQASANLADPWELPGGLTAARISDAWSRVVTAHETLRTTYRWRGVTPTQTVYQLPSTPLQCFELEQDTPAGAVRSAAELAAAAFDIENEVPWRVRLATRGATPRYLIVVLHHVAADNSALTILKQQFMALLNGDKPAPAVQPRDLAHAEQSDPATSDAIVDHWLDAWPGFLAEDRKSDDISKRRRAEIYSTEALDAAHQISARLRISLQSTVLTAGTLVLSRLTGRSDFTFSLMAANRLDPRWASLISSLNQCAPITISLDESALTDACLRRIYFQCLDSYLNGMYDVDALRDRLRQKGEEEDPTFFAKHFNFLGEMGEEPPADAPIRSGVTLRASQQRSGPNLHIVMAVGEGLYIGVGASEDLLPGREPAMVAAGIESALINMAKAGDMPLSSLSIEPLRDVSFP